MPAFSLFETAKLNRRSNFQWIYIAGNDFESTMQTCNLRQVYLYICCALTSELFESTGLNFPLNVQKSAEIQTCFIILPSMYLLATLLQFCFAANSKSKQLYFGSHTYVTLLCHLFFIFIHFVFHFANICKKKIYEDFKFKTLQ